MMGCGGDKKSKEKEYGATRLSPFGGRDVREIQLPAPHFDPDHSLASSPGAGMLHWCDFEPRRCSHGLWVGAGLHPTSHSSVGCQNPCAAGLQRIKNQFILGIPKFTSQSVSSHYAEEAKTVLLPHHLV